MKVSLQWLEQYFEEQLNAQEIEELLTKLGLEVEEHTELGKDVSKVVTGRIEHLEKHPDADKLQICKINVGEEALLTIITGATNVYVGMIVPVALVGAKVVGGEIKESTLRGLSSYGMLCSGEELGLDNSLLPESAKQGILPLEEDLPLGADVKDLLGLKDHILELGLTPNRADCYGLYNVAKEITLKKPYGLKTLEGIKGSANQSSVSIEIKDERLCHRYVARVIKDVVVKPSPRWFANLLRNVGIRPINNIVDVTNYVMVELGQPMHAFDLGKIEGQKIIVECGRPGEKFVTLDGQERELDQDMLVIKDQEKTLALAGVMGGMYSEVVETTTEVLLEAAHFNSENIRKTSRRMGLRSEASGRFERGLSEENVLLAMERASYLVELLGIGKIEENLTDSYPVKQVIPWVPCKAPCINQILGMEIPEEEIKEIFIKLGFQVKSQGTSLLVKPEAHRIDIQDEIDLVEEVVRVYGYDNIPATLPVGSTNTLKASSKISLVEEVKNQMVHTGINEVISYSFIDGNSYGKCGLKIETDPRLKVMNPLSETQGVMRESLMPGLLEIASRNYKRQRRNLSLFEVGRIFHGKEGRLPQEDLHLGLFLLENKIKEWQGTTLNDFYQLKGIIENLLNQISDEEYLYEAATDQTSFHPGRCSKILSNSGTIGYLGEVHPLVLETFDIKEKAYYAEINLESIREKGVKQYQGLPKYPFIERDLAIILGKDIEYGQVYQVIRDVAGKKVIKARVFDVYEGSPIEEGMKSVAFALTYQDMEKTLTDEEVNGIHQGIIKALEEKLGAALR